MNSRPAVSVVIPTYNRCRLLMRAVRSALAQTIGDVEVIVVDDGSTDGTVEMLHQQQDPCLRYAERAHQGACAARNAGMLLAKGRYIAFLDSDDVWHENKLERQVAQLERSGADVVFCAFLRHDEAAGHTERCPAEDEKEQRIEAARLLSGNIVSTQTLLGRADCMKQVRFDERLPRMQDWDFAIRLAQGYHLRYFPEVLVDTYLQPDSISAKPELGLEAMRLLCSKYRHELETSMPGTLTMLGAIRRFAEQCGEDCVRDYWQALSPRRDWRDNCRLLKGSASAMLHGLRRSPGKDDTP